MGIIKKFESNHLKIKPIIEFKDVSLAYGKRKVLDGISFNINEKTIHGLLGPNGAGKSTLYHLMTGLLTQKMVKFLLMRMKLPNCQSI